MLVAEGIERDEIRERLSAMGCEYGQGNAISRPLPHGEFCRWLSTGNTMNSWGRGQSHSFTGHS